MPFYLSNSGFIQIVGKGLSPDLAAGIDSASEGDRSSRFDSSQYERFQDLHKKRSTQQRLKLETTRGRMLINLFSGECKTAQLFEADMFHSYHYRRCARSMVVYNGDTGDLAMHSVEHFLGLPRREVERYLKLPIESVSGQEFQRRFPGFEIDSYMLKRGFNTPDVVVSLGTKDDVHSTLGRFWRNFDKHLLKRAKASGV